jgi:hypothetical protein
MTHPSITKAVPGDQRPEADGGQHTSPTTNTTTADQKHHRLRMVAADRASHAQSEAFMMRLLSYDPQRHITTKSASFSASLMEPAEPTRTAALCASLTGLPITLRDRLGGRR